MKIETTANTDIMFISVLVYGRSKVGKTRIISTCEAPFILNVENSLVSLIGHEIPVVNIKTVKEFAEVMGYLTRSQEAKQYKTICLDSVSELAELILSEEKSRTKDARQAYGTMQDEIFKVVRAITSLPYDCYVIAKAEKGIGVNGETIFAPYIPSTKAAIRLPYLFDETFALREIMMEGEKEPKPWLQCRGDLQWEAGDKSGKLQMWEEADIRKIFSKIRSKSIEDVRELISQQQKEEAKKKDPIYTSFKEKAIIIRDKANKANALNDAVILRILTYDWYELCNQYTLHNEDFIVPIDIMTKMHKILDLPNPLSIEAGCIDYGDKQVFIDELLRDKKIAEKPNALDNEPQPTTSTEKEIS